MEGHIIFDRIKHWETSDLMYGAELRKVEGFITKFSEERACSDISHALELYSVHLYIADGCSFPEWDDAFKEKMRDVDKIIMRMNGVFVSTITNENFPVIFNQVNVNDLKEFWELIAKYKGYKRLEWNTIAKCLNRYGLKYLLMVRELVQYFDEDIADYMKSNVSSSGQLIIEKYMYNQNPKRGELHLPKSLSPSEKEQILSDFIDGQNVNPNYLEKISQWRSSGELAISDRTRLKAKRLYSESIKKLFDKTNMFQFGVSVSFCDQDELIKVETQGLNLKYTYNREHIRNNTDPFDLIKNFVNLFGVVDSQGRSLLVSKPSQLSIFEREFGGRGTSDYPKGIAFMQKEMTFQIQMQAYDMEVRKNGSSLESAFMWYFNSWIPKQYAMNGISMALPVDGSYLVKCRNLFPEIEKILKAFKLYIEDGYVDLELLQFTSSPLIYENVPSQIKHKYVYGKGEDFKIAEYLISSDQCMLSYLPNLNKEYKSFYDLILHEKIKATDYPEYNQADLKWLIEKGFLEEEDGYLKPVGTYIHVIQDLHENEVIAYYRMPKEVQDEIDDMVQRGWAYFGETLFSIPEQNYISFILDRNKYGNGYDIRNKYLHGSMSGDADEEQHRKNYYIGILILVLALLKIDDECAFAKKDNSTSSKIK